MIFALNSQFQPFEWLVCKLENFSVKALSGQTVVHEILK